MQSNVIMSREHENKDVQPWKRTKGVCESQREHAVRIANGLDI